ncbi:hypothetical protein HMPREF1576_00421 [Gardnerella pickettii JCP7719]|uniref:Uncharacterized protein n=1 Tax=Gardnerella pickettii JCP7719 TaxID=1261061 RepID=S4GYY6_9BIFI|nr:hypothetical protein HMPREF1576_00421 [Gardnerella pickettii JCP7719]
MRKTQRKILIKNINKTVKHLKNILAHIKKTLVNQAKIREKSRKN